MQLRKKIHTHGASFVSPRPSPDAPNVSPPPLLFLCPLLLSLLSTRVSRTRCQESRCHLPRSTSIFFSSSFTSALHSYSSNIYQEPSRALSLGSLAGLSRWALSLRSLAGLSRCALSLRSLAGLSRCALSLGSLAALSRCALSLLSLQLFLFLSNPSAPYACDPLPPRGLGPFVTPSRTRCPPRSHWIEAVFRPQPLLFLSPTALRGHIELGKPGKVPDPILPLPLGQKCLDKTSRHVDQGQDA